MTYLPFWAGGLALTAVVLLHYGLLRSQLGVSGRISTLVNRLRANARDEPQLSDDDMLAALRAMTESEFGADAVGEAPAPSAAAPVSTVIPTSAHLLFFGGLALGGFAATSAVGAFHPTPTVSGELFGRYVSAGPMGYLVLFGGGLLVGIGTRMSGGCTSGHGLIGVPRMQPGSLLATASFFGAGIAVSLLLEVVR